MQVATLTPNVTLCVGPIHCCSVNCPTCRNVVGSIGGGPTPAQRHQTFIDNLTKDPPSQYMAVIQKNYLL